MAGEYSNMSSRASKRGVCETAALRPWLHTHRMPRPPDRIPTVLDRVREIWTLYPDLRLGQLVANAAYSAGTRDVFNVEDDALLVGLTRLESLLARNETPGQPEPRP